MNIKVAKERFDETKAMAVSIGRFAEYRHLILTMSFPDEFDRLYESNGLKIHLKEIQAVMQCYMGRYQDHIMKTDEFNRIKKEMGESTAMKFLSTEMEKEEERIGNRFVCVKMPQYDDHYMEWLWRVTVN